MSLFNTQKKKVGNATAGETKISAKAPKKAKETKAVALPKALKVAEKKGAEKAKSQGEKRAEAAHGVSFPKGSAVIKPRVTEKAGLLSEKKVYTFDVRLDANTYEIAKVIAEVYKVTPVRVNTAKVKSKSMFVRGKRGKTIAGKKAYVTLKEGEKIEFI